MTIECSQSVHSIVASSSGALSKKRADLIDQRSVVILVVVIIKRIEASLDEHGEANVELHIICIFRFQAVNIFPDRRIDEVLENMRLRTGEQKLDQIDLRKEARCEIGRASCRERV